MGDDEIVAGVYVTCCAIWFYRLIATVLIAIAHQKGIPRKHFAISLDKPAPVTFFSWHPLKAKTFLLKFDPCYLDGSMVLIARHGHLLNNFLITF